MRTRYQRYADKLSDKKFSLDKKRRKFANRYRGRIQTLVNKADKIADNYHGGNSMIEYFSSDFHQINNERDQINDAFLSITQEGD